MSRLVELNWSLAEGSTSARFSSEALISIFIVYLTAF